jgi:hypothetical protein
MLFYTTLSNLFAKVPTMDTPDGPLWESNAMAKYSMILLASSSLTLRSIVARKGNDKGLYGSNEYEAVSIVLDMIVYVMHCRARSISGWSGQEASSRETSVIGSIPSLVS